MELMLRHVTGNHCPIVILNMVLLKASPSKSNGSLWNLAKIENLRIKRMGKAKKTKFVKTNKAIFSSQV